MTPLQRKLLGWFEQEKRDLPWRRTSDPYAIWISEVMLQQTQVIAVIPYWERFLARLPTVQSLAEAPLDDVLALWSGLGYYARARNLHRAAKAVVSDHGGKFPRDLNALIELPGFGPYTAGAVGSIALGLDAPLVDGNVARVLCRIEGWRLKSAQARTRAWKLAPQILPHGRAGDFNQSLMELGATVCTPAPKCPSCPVKSLCAASARGDPRKYPLPDVKKARAHVRLAALVVRWGDAVLLVRREEKGLFGGLWEPPTVVIDSKSAAAAARKIAQSNGVERIRHTGKVAQTLTHREMEVEVFSGTPSGKTEGRWVQPEELSSLGLSSLTAKILRAGGLDLPAQRRHGKPM